jgi:plasmid stabilization system protein ParE
MRRRYDVCWTKTAAQDLEAIVDYIAHESFDTALRILTKVRGAAATLSSTPHRGRVVPELRTHGILVYHELVVSPWRMIYRIGEGQVYVLAMFDSRRNLEDVLLERFTRQKTETPPSSGGA